jgi:hypothetical protein
LLQLTRARRCGCRVASSDEQIVIVVHAWDFPVSIASFLSRLERAEMMVFDLAGGKLARWKVALRR